MGGGGGGNNTTTTTRTELAPEQKPYVVDVLQQAQALSRQPMSFFPGQTYAPPSAATQAAINAQINRAVMGSPVTGAMNRQLIDTLGGSYLDAGNPYMTGVMNQIGNQVQNQMDSRFNAAGRFGSGAHAAATASALADAASRLAYQNYGDERQRQVQSMLFAPQAAQADYYDIAKLAEAGGVQEDIAQQKINEDIARFNFQQQEPWQRLMQYGSLAYGGNLGNSQTATQQGPGRSLGADLISGASALGSLGLLGYLALSDRRAKTDIHKVGKLNNGLPVYSYRYKFGGPTHIGVMAQDVQKVKPSAVHDTGLGLLAVDYNKAVR